MCQILTERIIGSAIILFQQISAPTQPYYSNLIYHIVKYVNGEPHGYEHLIY